MDQRTALKLVKQLGELDRRTPQVRLGVITDTDPLSVALGGSDIPYTNVTALDGATLATDDTVAALVFNRDLLILGRLGDGDSEDWHEVDSGGTEPAFQNSWTHYGAPLANVGFYRDALNQVHVRGAVKDGSPVTGTVFTLPAGNRPAYDLTFAQVNDPGGVVVVRVTAGGDVKFLAGGDAGFTGLDLPPFRAEQ